MEGGWKRSLGGALSLSLSLSSPSLSCEWRLGIRVWDGGAASSWDLVLDRWFWEQDWGLCQGGLCSVFSVNLPTKASDVPAQRRPRDPAKTASSDFLSVPHPRPPIQHVHGLNTHNALVHVSTRTTSPAPLAVFVSLRSQQVNADVVSDHQDFQKPPWAGGPGTPEESGSDPKFQTLLGKNGFYISGIKDFLGF